ncbi:MULTISPECIES: diacylglycerol/lipid kinase family protein [Brachymonas]|uniref:diacylglycerol/lipid kinase family protein n=1 Tax=Brachymonas TaxID=28219 RepID=UPI002E784B32|nr:diacylglycerol kinase family protein [Brachymonas sp. J145]MEE1652354.1 diacylglycerol kinase family protein [Brachymonas sp. J145]
MNPDRMALRPDAPLHVLMNAGSGSLDESHPDELRTALQASGRRWKLVALEPADIEQSARIAVAEAKHAGAIVVAAGGDGTINAVANAVSDSGCVMGVLPEGTFNYFCRAHGIATDPVEALQQLLHGKLVPVQAGRINGHLFLVNASLGLYPLLLEDRERFKATLGRSRLVAGLAAIYSMLRRPVQMTLAMSGQADGGSSQLPGQRIFRTPTLFVGNNALQLQQIGLLPASEGDALPTLDQELHAVVLAPVSTLRLFWLALRGALGSLGEEPESVWHFPFRQLQVHRHGYPGQTQVQVATDGEVRWMRTPLRFEIVPEALQLIVPDPDRLRPMNPQDPKAP